MSTASYNHKSLRMAKRARLSRKTWANANKAMVFANMFHSSEINSMNRGKNVSIIADGVKTKHFSMRSLSKMIRSGEAVFATNDADAECNTESIFINYRSAMTDNGLSDIGLFSEVFYPIVNALTIGCLICAFLY